MTVRYLPFPNAPDAETVGESILVERLPVFLAVAAELAKYDFGDSDLDAIEAGLAGTDYHQDVWLSYTLTGSRVVDLQLALDDPGSGIAWIRLTGEEELLAEVRGAASVIHRYSLAGGPYADSRLLGLWR